MKIEVMTKKIAPPASWRKGPRARPVCRGAAASLGFRAAGFLQEAAVEFDPDAANSHGFNFPWRGPEAQIGARDIITTRPDDLAAELGLGADGRRG